MLNRVTDVWAFARRCAFLVLGGLVAVTTTSVVAGSVDVGELVSIDQSKGSLVLVSTNGDRAAVPTCAAEDAERLVIDISTVGGQEQLRELLAMQEANKKVRIVGSGKCHPERGMETVSFFYAVTDTPTYPNR
jgi:hypothetical protein